MLILLWSFLFDFDVVLLLFDVVHCLFILLLLSDVIIVNVVEKKLVAKAL